MKIAVCISGGMDSFYALKFCIEKYESVEAVYLNFLNNKNQIEEVKKITSLLKVPLKIFNCQKEFKERIINYFIKEYLSGRTPNPCIFCNAFFKFEYVFSKGYEKVATGHYAKIEKINDKFFIAKGKDIKKDQSYFLARVKKEFLPNILLPLGDYLKGELKTKDAYPFKKSESQEVCFIPNGDYKKFLENTGLIKPKKGKILNSKGNLIGFHKGFYNFTIGQRKGLNISMGKPYYVLKIDPEKNIVYAGPAEETFNKEFTISSTLWYDNPQNYDDIFVKVRYRSSEKLCKIDERLKKVVLIERERSVTPGQIAVFYSKNIVIGSGIIESAK